MTDHSNFSAARKFVEFVLREKKLGLKRTSPRRAVASADDPIGVDPAWR
jgi:hypothetical protein